MKTIKKLAFGAVMLLFSITTKAQVYNGGNMIVDAYYGFPNGIKSILKTYETYGSGIKVSGYGPMGAKFEYLVTKRIGFGLHVNGANSSVSGITKSYNFNVGDYPYKATVGVFRVFPTLNVHMGSSNFFDPYFSFGAGYSKWSSKEESNDPNFVPLKVTIPGSVAIRVEFGSRFYFTEHLGAHIFFGIGGGALLGTGLSAKF